MREVGQMGYVLLNLKLYVVKGLSIAKTLERPFVLNWNKIPGTVFIFGSSPVIFETGSSADKTEPTYDSFYWSWHRVVDKVARVQAGSGTTVPRIF